MGISTGIPANWNLPLFWANVDGSKAGNLTEKQPALLVGQYYSAANPGIGGVGAAGANIPVPIGSPALGEVMFGKGSMLDRMIKAFFNVNTTQLLYAMPIPEPTGTAATGIFAIAGSPTNSGVLFLYIAGQLVGGGVVVNSTDTPTIIGAAVAAAINAQADLPVTAIATAGSVALTCRWVGLTGNDINLAVNFLGFNGGQLLPPGITVTVTPMASGSGNPIFTTAIANIQTLEFDYVGMPYTDTASMTVWSNEYGFSSGGRWNFTRQQYGFIFNAYRNTFASAITFGLTINSPVISTMVVEVLAPSPVWEWTGAYCGLGALAFTDDPARPLQTLEMIGILPAKLPDRFIQAQQNNLTNGGFAIQGVAPSGNPMILREQTQYQLNSFGQGDTAFGLLTVLATLQELLKRMRAAITSKYPRVKLIPDGTLIGPGQAAVTPTDLKAELVTEFLQAEFDGLVDNLPQFLANLIVEISDTNPNQVQVLWPPQLAGQLRQFEVLAQFRLLYPPVTLR